MNMLRCRLVIAGIVVSATMLSTGCVTMAPAPARSSKSPDFDEKVSKLALVVQDSTGKYRSNSGVLRQIEDEFIHQLLEKGFTLAGRSDVTAVLDELRVQHSGLTDKDAAKMARILNVHAVLIVSITDVAVNNERVAYTEYRTVPVRSSKGKTRYETRPNNVTKTEYTARGAIGARLIRTETEQILWMGTKSGSRNVQNSQDAEAVLIPIAGMVAEAFPSRVLQTPPAAH